MEQTIMNELRIPRIFVAISNARKLEPLRSFSLIFEIFFTNQRIEKTMFLIKNSGL